MESSDYARTVYVKPRLALSGVLMLATHQFDERCFCRFCGIAEAEWVDTGAPCLRGNDPADEQPEPY